MCGINGIIQFNGVTVEKTDILRMMDKQKERGPDDRGLFLDRNVGLGFVRLSIIDLSQAAHQPMISDDGRYVLIFNGEIFNYLELKKELLYKGYTFRTKADSEVLLYSYIEWGQDCLHRFNGMWAFIIYDKTERKIFAARDRYGIKPFYYYFDQNRFIFASEIPAVLAVVNNRPEADQSVIYDYLVFNRTDQTEATFFKEIKKLQHGHCFEIPVDDINGLKLKPVQWYNLRSNLKEPFKNPEEFKEAFIQSVKLRLRSDVPVGICLSGGLDSSAIVSVILKDFGLSGIKTFSAVYGSGMYGDESEFINEFSDRISGMHFTTPSGETLINDLPDFVRAHGEPIPSTSPYAQYKVMELASKNVVVTLDGQGADEMLAGYHYFFGFYFKELLKSFRLGKLLKEAGYYYRNHNSLYGFKTLGYFLLPSEIMNKTRIKEKGYLTKEFIKRYSGNNTITGNLYSSGSLHEALMDHFEFKLEHLLKWEDRNSMHYSIEARVPFLDHNLVEKTLSLSSEKIIEKGSTKAFFRKAMEGTLPEKIRTRKDKIGFATPQAEWFRSKIFREYISDLISSQSFIDRGIIDHVKAQIQYNSHLSGKADISRELWKWINLEQWYKEFLN